MSRINSWAARAARSLSAHLDRLRETLDRLHGRLKEAVADAVSGSTAMAVKDAVLAAMLAHEDPLLLPVGQLPARPPASMTSRVTATGLAERMTTTPSTVLAARPLRRRPRPLPTRRGGRADA